MVDEITEKDSDDEKEKYIVEIRKLGCIIEKQRANNKELALSNEKLRMSIRTLQMENIGMCQTIKYQQDYINKIESEIKK